MAGTYLITSTVTKADLSVVQHYLKVKVMDVDIHKAIACEVGFQREKNVVVTPFAQRSNVVFTTNDSYLLDVSEKGPFNNTDGQGTTLYLKTKKRGTPILLARLPGAFSPMLALKEIDEYTVDTSADAEILLNVDTSSGSVLFTMRPYIPNVRFQFDMFAHTSTFSAGQTTLSVNTNDPEFVQVFNPLTGEYDGEYIFNIEMPAGEDAYCFNLSPHQSASIEVAIGAMGSVNGKGCQLYMDQLTLCKDDTVDGDDLHMYIIDLGEKQEEAGTKHEMKITGVAVGSPKFKNETALPSDVIANPKFVCTPGAQKRRVIAGDVVGIN